MREVRSPNSPEVLTQRETEVLLAIAHGLSNSEIAAKLFITEKTVETHVSNILGKPSLPSRTCAALCALKIDLLSLDEINLKA